jgi:hypothetical protein
MPSSKIKLLCVNFRSFLLHVFLYRFFLPKLLPTSLVTKILTNITNDTTKVARYVIESKLMKVRSALTSSDGIECRIFFTPSVSFSQT